MNNSRTRLKSLALAASSLLLLAGTACAQYRWVSFQLGNTNSTAKLPGLTQSNYYSAIELPACKTVNVEVRYRLLPGAAETAVWTPRFCLSGSTNRYPTNTFFTAPLAANGTNEVFTNFTVNADGWRYLYYLTSTNGNTNTMTNVFVGGGYKYGL